MSRSAGIDPFAEDEDQAALRQLAREVAEREIGSRASQWDETGEVPREAIKALAAADMFRVTIGERWGRLGMGDVEAAIVLEEIARFDVSAAICCQLTFNGPPRGIEHPGSEALKELGSQRPRLARRSLASASPSLTRGRPSSRCAAP